MKAYFADYFEISILLFYNIFSHLQTGILDYSIGIT